MAGPEAYVTGIGLSEIGVRLTRSPLQLTADAAREALADAGLAIAQIDGVASYPGRLASNLGYGPVGVDEVIDAFGIRPTWYMGAAEISSQLATIQAAAAAIRAGQARHVLCFRTVYEAAAMARPEEFPRPPAGRASGIMQWFAPFNALSPAIWTAQYAMRHVQRYGMTREQLGAIAVNAYANAKLNPRAPATKPVTLDDYMAARMISSPLCLYDCDRFTDASTVLIVSSGDALDEVKGKPVRLAASAGAIERHSYDQYEWDVAYSTGPDLWARTDYTPADVDLAQLYDGFSFCTIAWLEGLGFCGVGEGGRFVEGGSRIAIDGELPVNTGGGQIGGGRLHGYGLVHEAITQLRGDAGERQVPGDPKVAVASAGTGPLGTALLFARD